MKRKLLFIAAIFVLAFITQDASAQWVQTNIPAGHILALTLIDTNLFAGTDSGAFLSTNSGTSWTSASQGLISTGVSAFAASGTNLIAGTDDSSVFLSTNNGTSWMHDTTGLSIKPVYSLAVDGTNLFAGTWGGGVFLSTDNGTSWASASTGLPNGGLYVYSHFVVSGTNLFVGTFGGVFFSTNHGTSWIPVNSGLPQTIMYSLAGIGINTSAPTIFVGCDSGVFLSADTGSSWQTASTGLPPEKVLTLIADGNNLFAGIAYSGVYLSTNNGTSWSAVNNGLTDLYDDAFALSDKYLFAGTQKSGVWRIPLSDFGINAVSPTSTTQNSLSTYPNPFPQSTTITLTTPASGVAELSVVNLLGEEVAHLYDGELGAGEHSFSWNARGLPAGTYLGVVRMNGLTQELPMLLSR